jgi:hypothetical protein
VRLETPQEKLAGQAPDIVHAHNVFPAMTLQNLHRILNKVN